MTIDECIDVADLAKSLGVRFSSARTSDGMEVSLGDECRGFARYGEAFVFLMPSDPKDEELCMQILANQGRWDFLYDMARAASGREL